MTKPIHRKPKHACGNCGLMTESVLWLCPLCEFKTRPFNATYLPDRPVGSDRRRKTGARVGKD